MLAASFPSTRLGAAYLTRPSSVHMIYCKIRSTEKGTMANLVSPKLTLVLGLHTFSFFLPPNPAQVCIAQK